jgi:hypothetical protein
VLAKEEQRGAGDISDTFYQRGGQQGKERGGLGRSPQRRETGGERGGGASVTVESRHRPVAERCARGIALSRGGGVADPWARGHSNGRRGLNRFKFK